MLCWRSSTAYLRSIQNPIRAEKAAQQIVRRERRERISHEALLNSQLTLSRGRVNSIVRPLLLCGCEKIMDLDAEAERATELLKGKVVACVKRFREGEVLVEFEDGTRLYVDRSIEGVELSITGGGEE